MESFWRRFVGWFQFLSDSLRPKGSSTQSGGKPRTKIQREHFVGESAPQEMGYGLVVVSMFCFIMVAALLLNQNEVRTEKIQISYLKETSGREFSPAEALSELQKGRFTPSQDQQGQLDLGYMREGAWVLLHFANPQDAKTRDFVLQLRHTYINGSLTPLVGGNSQEGFTQAKLGETKEFTDRLLPRTQLLNDIRHVSFPVSVSQGESYHALIRLKAHVMNVPFVLLEQRTFLSAVIRELVPLAALFGGLLLLALYNTMVGFARREPEFVFYGVYVASIALMSASINGTGHMFLWPDVLWLHYNSANILINLVSLSYMAFYFSIFQKTPLRGWEKFLWTGFVGLCCVGFLLQIFEGGFYASIEANLAALGALSLGLVRAWRAREQYGRLATLFLLSECVLFVGAALYCVKMFGWLPSTTFTLNIVLVSATIEAILLSFVLSEKMRRTMQEKDDAMQQLETAHSQLEASVRDRTLALAARYTSHEVLNPVFAIRLKAERINDELVRESQSGQPSFTRVAGTIQNKTNEIFHLIDSIIQTIRAIKSIGSEQKQEEMVIVDVRVALDDALKMMEVKTLQVRAEVEIDVPEGACVHARRSDVVQILSNLISNALDAVAGQSVPWIRVSAASVSGSQVASGSSADVALLELSVEDNGPGPSADVRDKLFEAHVTTKSSGHGMGLGLSFCQRLVSRNGGTIGFDPQSARTRFFFRLSDAAVRRTVSQEGLARVA